MSEIGGLDRNGSMTLDNISVTSRKQQQGNGSQTYFERPKDNRKVYEKIEDFSQGLDLTQDMVCDLADHEREKILYVCVCNKCLAPRKLACGYCSSQYHGDHLKDLVRVKQFRDTSVKARSSLNNVLHEFTQPEKRNLLDQTLFEVVLEKQLNLAQQFENFLKMQKEQIEKLIEANVENYLYEESEALSRVGGFYERVEKIFDLNWQQVGGREVNTLIQLHHTYEEQNQEIERLDIKRQAISKELIDMMQDYFLQAEILISDLEQESVQTIRKLLDKAFAQGGIDSKLDQSGYASISTKKESLVMKTSQQFNENDASKDFHTTLFKEAHAPKSGWRSIDTVPLKYIEMPYLEKCEKKYGKFKYKDVLPASLEVIDLPPVCNQRGDVYQGQWRNGFRWGRGKFWWKDGHFYEGTWEKGKPSGYGRMIYRNGNMYEGQFLDEKRHGRGVHNHLCGSKYEGEWRDDLPHGNGLEVLMNGDIFNGTFMLGLKEGKGELKGVDGSVITGWWKQNKLTGKGEWLHADKRLYIGDFKEDMKHGEGILIWPDGRKYEGQFSRNRMHGVGIWFETDGSIRRGEWQHGKRVAWTEELKKGDSFKNKNPNYKDLKVTENSKKLQQQQQSQLQQSQQFQQQQQTGAAVQR